LDFTLPYPYHPQPPGRLGGETVTLSLAEGSYHHQARSDGFGGIEASTNFPSLLGDVAVGTGRWMYEVTLLTSGLMQLGWCTKDCVFNYDHGVGDSPGSFFFSFSASHLA